MWSDQGVSHEVCDVEQAVGNHQWSDTLPTQIDEAEYHAHDQVCEKGADSLVEMVGAADGRAEGNDGNNVPSELAQSGEQVADHHDLLQHGILYSGQDQHWYGPPMITEPGGLDIGVDADC